MTHNILGFSTAPSEGGDFTPIVKYDARAGRLFRMDRIENNGNFANQAVDITQSFKAIADFENMEVGWILFAAGTAPDFNVVRIGKEFPARPSDKHKHGVRLMIKLAKDCSGDKPIREMAGTSKALLAGLEAVYTRYLAEKDDHPGKLPSSSWKRRHPSGPELATAHRPTISRRSRWSDGRRVAIWAAWHRLTAARPPPDRRRSKRRRLPKRSAPTSSSCGARKVAAKLAPAPLTLPAI